MQKETWNEKLVRILKLDEEKWTKDFILLLAKKTVGWLLMLAFYCVVGAALMYGMSLLPNMYIYEPVQLGWMVGAVAWAVVLGFNIYGSTPPKRR